MRGNPWTLLLLLVTLCAPSAAAGFAVAVTATDEMHELHWDDWVVPYTVDFHGSDDLHDVLLRGAVWRSFETWGAVDGAGLQFLEEARYADAVSEPEGVNLLYWIEEGWPHEAGIIALTSINYYPDSGQIVDVDIAFNGLNYAWSVLDDHVQTDVQAIATHEIGHLFGLDHSVPSSVMGASYDTGETRQRYLTDDDIAGIVYLYPCGDAAAAADEFDHNRSALECDLPFYDPRACAVGGAGGRAGLWIVGALALGLALLRRSAVARLPLLLWAAAMIALPPAAPPSAAVTPYHDLDAVLRAADAVVLAEVEHIEPHWADMGRHVHSRVALRVDRYLRGSGPPELILDRPAGVLPELATYVPGEPRFVEGRPVVLALSLGDHGRWQLTGLAQGYLEITSRDGANVARRRPEGALDVRPGDPVEEYRLSALVEHIRRLP